VGAVSIAVRFCGEVVSGQNSVVVGGGGGVSYLDGIIFAVLAVDVELDTGK